MFPFSPRIGQKLNVEKKKRFPRSGAGGFQVYRLKGMLEKLSQQIKTVNEFKKESKTNPGGSEKTFFSAIFFQKIAMETQELATKDAF